MRRVERDLLVGVGGMGLLLVVGVIGGTDVWSF